jgi:hypothetical protein
MAITQNVLFSGVLTLSGGTISQSVTVPSGAEIIVVSLVFGSAVAPTGVSYNSVALTSQAGVSDGNTRHASIWDLLAPTVGTFNVTITASTGENATCAVVVRTLQGIDTATPRGTAQTFGGFNSNRSVTLTTAVDDVVIDIIGNINTLTPTDARATQYNAVNAVGTTDVASSIKVATGTSTVMHWTHGSEWTVLAAVPYRNLAGGGPTPAPSFGRYGVRGPVR